MKTLKGLTQKLIKISKNSELQFSKEDLKNIKETANVSFERRKNGSWTLSVYTKYNDSCCGGYYWKGSFSWYNESKEGSMSIFSGFTGNPIGRVENNYTCKRPYGTDYRKEFETIIEYMTKARGGSLASNRAYCDFVRRTGCLD